MNFRPSSRRFLIAESIQTAAKDSGPSALRSIFHGFNIPVSIGQIRKLGQTEFDEDDYDGLAALLKRYGLDVKHRKVSVESFVHEHHYPLLVRLSGLEDDERFAVIWRRFGNRFQVMDTQEGRRWPKIKDFLKEISVSQKDVEGKDWYLWATSEENVEILRNRLTAMGMNTKDSVSLMSETLGSNAWLELAKVDACVRVAESLSEDGTLKTIQERRNSLANLLKNRHRVDCIPDEYWAVSPSSKSGQLQARYVDILDLDHAADHIGAETSAPQVKRKKVTKPLRYLIKLMLMDGYTLPILYLVALVVMIVIRIVEAFMFRALLDMAYLLTPDQRVAGMGMFVAFLSLLLMLLFLINHTRLRIGSRIEARMRIAFAEKIPKLGDSYLHTLSLGDMAERAHSIAEIRQFSVVGSQIINTSLALISTGACLIWLNPFLAPLAFVGTLLIMFLPFFLEPFVSRRDLKHRTHGGALTHFFLDSLLGLSPCRTHGAEKAVRREHERMLTHWLDSGLSLQSAAVIVEGVSTLAAFTFAAILLRGHIATEPEIGTLLLFLYWSLKLPLLGEAMINSFKNYPGVRNRTHRLLEAIDAPDERDFKSKAEVNHPVAISQTGVDVELSRVNLKLMGHEVLHQMSFRIKPGEHVVVVGPSGAGKSTLAGLLLGWNHPSEGGVYVDGKAYNYERIEWLREHTAWIGPSVKLWNRTFLDNVSYGSERSDRPMSEVIDGAKLHDVLEKLPDGLQTLLGENGTFLSGGQGQRIRLARAFLKTKARLVILDEPFRGLDRKTRHDLMVQVREWWPKATIVFITHDVNEALLFDRVLVINKGQLAEDDDPKVLATQEGTIFKSLLDSFAEVDRDVWGSPQWRRIYLEQGQVDQNATEGDVYPGGDVCPN